jgi:hypothetical protein
LVESWKAKRNPLQKIQSLEISRGAVDPPLSAIQMKLILIGILDGLRLAQKTIQASLQDAKRLLPSTRNKLLVPSCLPNVLSSFTAERPQSAVSSVTTQFNRP